MNVEQKIEGGVKRQKGNTSDESNVDIPEEIQIDILSRLPPKSLSRCRCVSKHWYDTLTIHAFLIKHNLSYEKHPQLVFAVYPGIWGENSVLSFEHSDDNTPKPTVPILANSKSTPSVIKGRNVSFTNFLLCKNIYMSHICNDLVCLFNQSSKRSGLFNIRTRDFIRLPAITIKSLRAFRSWYALGYDPIHKVFKVLSIIFGNTSKKSTTTKAAILTIGSKYWKPIDYKCLTSSLTKSRLPMRSATNTICLDGVIYWVHKNTIDNVSVLTVVAFDLNHETFRDYELVRTPIEDGTFSYYLTSVKGCPTLLLNNKESDEVQQWTLFNHKNLNVAWNRRSFTSNDFPTSFPYDYHWTSATGSSILVRNMESSFQDLMKAREGDDSERSYLLYNLEKLTIETE